MMEAMIADTHFHILSMREKGIDTDSLLSRMDEEGMTGIDIGTVQGDLAERRNLIGSHSSYALSAGIGPWAAGDSVEKLRKEIEDDGNVCAIGEIGLDNHERGADPERQEELFQEQLDLAEEMKKPVIIHTREADRQMERILRSRSFCRQGIMHCFEGGEELLEAALAKGFFISFSGAATYRHNERLLEMAGRIPSDRILLETDSPYLSPVPVRGQVNTPLNIVHTYRAVARVRGISAGDLAETVAANLRAFLGGR